MSQPTIHSPFTPGGPRLKEAEALVGILESEIARLARENELLKAALRDISVFFPYGDFEARHAEAIRIAEGS